MFMYMFKIPKKSQKIFLYHYEFPREIRFLHGSACHLGSACDASSLAGLAVSQTIPPAEARLIYHGWGWGKIVGENHSQYWSGWWFQTI